LNPTGVTRAYDTAGGARSYRLPTGVTIAYDTAGGARFPKSTEGANYRNRGGENYKKMKKIC